MKDHLLLDKAYIYPRTRLQTVPDGCHYDDDKGYWVDNGTGKPFVTLDKHQALTSKKRDVETGEDEKGE